jgi:hypothetical protein
MLSMIDAFAPQGELLVSAAAASVSKQEEPAPEAPSRTVPQPNEDGATNTGSPQLSAVGGAGPTPPPGPPPMLMGDVLSFKTRLCNNFLETGTCRYAARCRFAHGPSDMRSQDDNIRDGLFSEQALVVFQAAMRNRLDPGLPMPTADGALFPHQKSMPLNLHPFQGPSGPSPLTASTNMLMSFDQFPVYGAKQLLSSPNGPQGGAKPGTPPGDQSSSSMGSSGSSFGSPVPLASPFFQPPFTPVFSPMPVMGQQQHNALYTLVPSQQMAAPMHHVPPSMMQPHPQFFPQPPMQQFYFQQPQLMGWPGAGAAPVYIQQQQQMQMFMPCQQVLMTSGQGGADGRRQTEVPFVPAGQGAPSFWQS